MNRRRTLPRAMAALAIVGALALSACSEGGGGGGPAGDDYKFTSATSVGELIPVADRKPADDFTGDLLSGGTTTLSKVTHGKPALINFFASWCGPCQVETPQIAQYADRMSGKVAFLGVDTRDQRPDGPVFVSQSGIKYPVLFDQQGKINLALGGLPGSPPFTVLLDDKGRVAAVYLARFAIKDLQKPISALLAEH